MLSVRFDDFAGIVCGSVGGSLCMGFGRFVFRVGFCVFVKWDNN